MSVLSPSTYMSTLSMSSPTHPVVRTVGELRSTTCRKGDDLIPANSLYFSGTDRWASQHGSLFTASHDQSNTAPNNLKYLSLIYILLSILSSSHLSYHSYLISSPPVLSFAASVFLPSWLSFFPSFSFIQLCFTPIFPFLIGLLFLFFFLPFFLTVVPFLHLSSNSLILPSLLPYSHEHTPH